MLALVAGAPREATLGRDVERVLAAEEGVLREGPEALVPGHDKTADVCVPEPALSSKALA
eukprot:8100144-Alexandrium_andersonii.AAC.1